ncbi:flagellar assembly protein FliW [Paenibacillus ginsengihumi]|uniref:flagellar assembly protein FliW n=1 Tax=Paenibacillus ginsengihumi TaxID=431596 RepID=UPI00036F83AE|nr:flagellar assembly protein FliW [Paenibacillus ginsengihumi]
MMVQSRVLGPINVEEEQVIFFPEGIPGFESYKKYVIVPLNEELPFAYLQSVEEGNLHFVIADPFAIFPDYELELSKEDQELLEIESEREVSVWVVCTVHDRLEEATLNLLAPLILNSRNRFAKQAILHHSGYSTKHKLVELLSRQAKKEG